MHEIDDQVLVDALASVIKSSVDHEGEWAHAQNCLSYPITSKVLLAKHWTVLEIASPDKLSREFTRADFVFIENIVFHTLQKYVQIKKLDNASLRVSEEDRDHLRTKIVTLLPEAFSCDELKAEWIEEKKEIQKSNLSSELKCALRYAHEKITELMKKVFSAPLEKKRNAFIAEIHLLKESLKKIESNHHLTLFQKKINEVGQVRNRLKTIEDDLERECIFFDKIQESIVYLKSLITEIASLIKMMTMLLTENKSKLLRDQTISDRYTNFAFSFDEIEKKFSTICQNGFSQDLALTDKELQSMLASVCRLQKEGGSLLNDIQNLKKVLNSETKAVLQGVYRKRFFGFHKDSTSPKENLPVPKS